MLSIEQRRSKMTVTRQVTRSARVTTIYEEFLIVKEFLATKRHKREWVIEHDIIQFLSKLGIAVPKSYGYFADEHRAAIYKEYVPGRLLNNFDGLAERLAQLFAALHEAMVITRDAHNKNVIETDGGELMFIDFGKARVFKSGNFIYWATLVREHFFIKSKLLENKATYERFLNFYLKSFSYGNRPLLKAAIISGSAILQLRDHFRQNRRNRKARVK